MSGELNLVKLCVGAEKVSDLVRWRDAREAEARANGIDYSPNHITRMWPRREAELLDGGSLYWVFKGLILARQRIVQMDEVIGEDGIRRCALIFEHDLMLTEAHRRRPFQGWRYLTKTDAPKDIGLYRADQEEIPGALRAELSDLGIL